MTPSNVPTLCGGILFDLLLEAKRPRKKARDKFNSGSDGLSTENLYAGFITLLTGEDMSSAAGATLKKCASNYKKCESVSGSYAPFMDSPAISCLDDAYKRKDPELYSRLIDFVDTFLNKTRCEWLTKALIETLLKDKSIPRNLMIATGYDSFAEIQEFEDITTISFFPFLLSVIHYVMTERPDCEPGRPTFEAWYSQKSPKAEWVFSAEIGKSVGTIDIDFTEPEVFIDSHISDSDDWDQLSDDEVLVQPAKKALTYFAEVLSAVKHEQAKRIREQHRKEAQEDIPSDETVSPSEKEGNTTIIQHQTNVIQNGDNSINLNNSGTINIDLGGKKNE